MNLYLNPNGRIDQPTYWQGAIVLAVISALLWLLSAFVNPFFFMLGFIFWWPWIAVHVKRLHDANLTGWIVLGLIVGAIVLYFIIGSVIGLVMGTPDQVIELQAELDDAQRSQDIDLMMQTLTQMMRVQLLPTVLTLFALTGAIGLIMGFLKTDPNDNQYGPGPGDPSLTFN